jgi:zinc protease
VVKEEYRQGVLAPPYGKLFWLMDDKTFQKHPYRRGVIGNLDELSAATRADAEAFYKAFYRPDNAVLIVVGEFDPAAVEAKIRACFGDWQGSPAPPQPDPGPFDFARGGETDIHLDPALSERVTVSAIAPRQDETDTIAKRRRNVLRQIGYGIVNRRLQRLTRADDPPFRGAGLGDSDVFETAHATNLVIDAGEGEWRRALAAAQAEYRKALAFGFSEAEVAEQVANIRTAQENAAAAAPTRPNATFVSAALLLLQEGQVPTTPQSGLARFEAFAPQITPEAVLAALEEELVPLDEPPIRFQGRTAPEGGVDTVGIPSASASSTFNRVPAP